MKFMIYEIDLQIEKHIIKKEKDLRNDFHAVIVEKSINIGVNFEIYGADREVHSRRLHDNGNIKRTRKGINGKIC